MAIERIIMLEGLQSSDSNIPASGSHPPEQGISPVEPNVVVSPDARRGGVLQRLLGRGPKVEVLVQPEKPKPSYTKEFDRTKLGQYTFKTEGVYSVAIDPKTNKEVARVPIVAGGAPENPLQGDEEFPVNAAEWGFDENIWGPEFAAQGIATARELTLLQAEVMEQGYNDENGPRLNRLYEKWIAWYSLRRQRANEREEFEESQPPKEDPEQKEKEALLNSSEDTLEDIPYSYEEAFQKYRNPDSTREEISEAKTYLNRYFKEAKRMGLLDGVYKILLSEYVQIMDAQAGQSSSGIREEQDPSERGKGSHEDQIAAIIEAKMGNIVTLGKRIFNGLQRDALELRISGTSTDQAELERLNAEASKKLAKLDKLGGPNISVWTGYAELASNRFALVLSDGGRVQPPSMEWEFQFKNGEKFRELFKTKEVFWRQTYGKYFQVDARTPEQFRTALNTFTQWLRSGFTKDPAELFQLVSGFKEAFTLAGQRELGRVSKNVINGLRREMEAVVGVMGANWANEHYNSDYYKQFLTLLAKEEGPARMARLSRFGDGKLAAALWRFDNDPTLELLFSPHGSQGQLAKMRNAVEQEALQEHIMGALIAEMVGASIKEYHPEDPSKNLKRIGKNGKVIDKENNLNDVVKFQSREEFQRLFEGFDQKAQDKLYQELSQRQYESQNSDAIQNWENEGGSVVNVDARPLNPAEKQALERLTIARQIQEHIKSGKSASELTVEAKDMYDETASAVNLAYELYGMMGEKAKRGGGIFQVDNRKNTYIETYEKYKDVDDATLNADQKRDKARGRVLSAVKTGTAFADLSEEDRIIYDLTPWKSDFKDYIPIHLAERFVQFAENWTKAEYSRSEHGNMRKAENMKKKVSQARKFAIWALQRNGHDAQLFDFTLKRKVMDKEGNQIIEVVDLEKHLGEDRYGNSLYENVLGFDKDGNKVILTFDKVGYALPVAIGKNGEWVEVQYEEHGRGSGIYKPILYDQPKEETYTEVNKEKTKIEEKIKQTIKVWDPNEKDEDGHHGAYIERARQRLYFDNLTKDKDAQGIKLKIRTPKIKRDSDGDIVRIVPTKRNSKPDLEGTGSDRIEFKDVTFQSAVDHIYSRHTSHSYWGYQEEDQRLLMTPQAIAAARRIRDGLSRAEDEEPHATQLLLVDPTLERIGEFEDLENRKDGIVLAAVEDSYQSFIRLSDQLHEVFIPPLVDRGRIRTVHGLQDHGGSTKDWMHHRARATRWRDANVRRLWTITADLPLHFYSMSETWGAGSALDTLRMMSYGTRDGEEGDSYKMVGLFALEKWIGQVEAAGDVFEALYGFRDTQAKRSREGLGEKPTNDADLLRKFYEKWLHKNLTNTSNEDYEKEYLDAVRESLGRYAALLARVRVLETDARGERGPLWLEGTDIWMRNVDGSFKIVNGERVFNTKIDTMRRDTGSSRHSGDRFHRKFIRWLRSNKPNEGQRAYTAEAKYYALMDEPSIAAKKVLLAGLGEPGDIHPATRWDWEADKERR